ncbi:uncharacterized protein PG986_013466 [Apiospora aurea]|uniref:Uncharacterized protein n=1 Tax=Apiospora aurea TaxID=335848 RepID=A0ABR1PVP2_9PEZI
MYTSRPMRQAGWKLRACGKPISAQDQAPNPQHMLICPAPRGTYLLLVNHHSPPNAASQSTQAAGANLETPAWPFDGLSTTTPPGVVPCRCAWALRDGLPFCSSPIFSRLGLPQSLGTGLQEFPSTGQWDRPTEAIHNLHIAWLWPARDGDPDPSPLEGASPSANRFLSRFVGQE